MSKLKRWIVLGVVFVLIMGLAGCGKSAETGKAANSGKEGKYNEANKRVVCQYDFYTAVTHRYIRKRV